MSENSDNIEDNEYVNIDDVADNLIKCYQIQIDEVNNTAKPMYIGSFESVPINAHTVFEYDQKRDRINKKSNSSPSITNKYKIHVVTYVMPEDSIKENIYKIVGLIVQKNNEDASICSLDLKYNVGNNKFEYVLCDHIKNTTEIVSTLDTTPKKDDVLPNLMSMIFEDPIKSIIVS
jgi:hypothetical protein